MLLIMIRTVKICDFSSYSSMSKLRVNDFTGLLTGATPVWRSQGGAACRWPRLWQSVSLPRGSAGRQAHFQ